MLHPLRLFHVIDVPSVAALAALVTGPPQPLDAAFRLGSTLFLNDSASPTGPQVYAAVRDGVELDGIQFSACSRDEAFRYIAELAMSRPRRAVLPARARLALSLWRDAPLRDVP